MSIKFGDFEDIKQFDKEKTVGILSYLACEPRFRFEEVPDSETGELKSMPTDEVLEYDVLVNSSVAKGNITITVPPTATGVEVDEDKAYRKPVVFSDLTARLWENRSRQMVNGQERTVSTTGTKFRASDFKVEGLSDVKPQLKQDAKKDN
ncbi:DUF961 family protein [Streptococcus canis]|uniref:DUF961 family protein n=2 Tax=Streptococcus canis TaxID=1329 RepID=UPI0011449DD4|nr:DUF961 family protein [Streptococcus canis]QKG76891.1 DUF961 family protein [Streptococcus canis]GEE06501.1 hypothetical protein ScOT1_05940 [Streptococcus canis]GMX35337.1 DUF961 family protein [Streptococcus canis]GMX39210.1 DUF961 family protein [Streptococcus canis]